MLSAVHGDEQAKRMASAQGLADVGHLLDRALIVAWRCDSQLPPAFLEGKESRPDQRIQQRRLNAESNTPRYGQPVGPRRPAWAKGEQSRYQA